MWCGGRELLDQPGVARRGLEHQRRPAHPARLPVQDDDGPAAQRVVPDEGLGTEQAGLLAVGEQHDEVVAQRSFRAQRPDGLEHCGDRGTVVGGTGTRGDGVVVRGEHDRAGRVGAWEGRDDVVDPPHRGFATEAVGSDRCRHPCVEALGAEPGDEQVADGVAGRAAQRPRLPGDRGDRLHRPRSAEGAGGRLSRLGPRRAQAQQRHSADRHEEQQGGGDDAAAGGGNGLGRFGEHPAILAARPAV